MSDSTTVKTMYDACECIGTPSFFLSLPDDLKIFILNMCPIEEYTDLLFVSSEFYKLISNIISTIQVFNFHKTPNRLNLLVNHSKSLKSIVGIVIKKSTTKNIKYCTSKQLIMLIKKNSNLEHLVMYDNGANYCNYLDNVLNALSSCENLKLLYSEAYGCENPHILHDFIPKMTSLSEFAFPNIGYLKSILDLHDWETYPTSAFFAHDHKYSIRVFKKKCFIQNSLTSQKSFVKIIRKN